MFQRTRRSTVMTAIVGAAAMLALAACGSGGSGGDDTAGSGGGSGDLIRVGFSQLGAESGWRTANTESVKAALS